MMRTFLIAAATAASALAIAAPASAQYYPQPPRGYAYGYDNYGGVRSLQARLNHLERQIERLDHRDIISEREARHLREDARELERRIYRAARHGLNPMERRELEYRLQRLEQKLVRDANDGHRWNRGYDGRWDRRY